MIQILKNNSQYKLYNAMKNRKKKRWHLPKTSKAMSQNEQNIRMFSKGDNEDQR